MCDFPSWIRTKDGRIHFLVDKDVESLIDAGALTCWEDGVGHSAIEKVYGPGGEHLERGNPPFEVLQAMREGHMVRMAKAAGYDHVFTHGRHEIRAGKAYACDSAVVYACDSAVVHARGSARVDAYDSAAVNACDSAVVNAYDSAAVNAYDSARVNAYDSARVNAYDSAAVNARGSAIVNARGSAIVNARGSAKVTRQ